MLWNNSNFDASTGCVSSLSSAPTYTGLIEAPWSLDGAAIFIVNAAPKKTPHNVEYPVPVEV